MVDYKRNSVNKIVQRGAFKLGNLSAGDYFFQMDLVEADKFPTYMCLVRKYETDELPTLLEYITTNNVNRIPYKISIPEDEENLNPCYYIMFISANCATKQGCIDTFSSVKTAQFGTGTATKEVEVYGKYKIPVKIKGKNLEKNLFDVDYYVAQAILSGKASLVKKDGRNCLKVTGWSSYATHLFEYDSSKEYTLQYEAFLDSTDQTGAGFSSITSTNGIIYHLASKNKRWETYTETIPIGHKYLLPSFMYSIDTYINLDSIMLVEGTSNDIAYEPHGTKTYNIYLDEPLRKDGNNVDYIDFENRQLVRKVGENVGTQTIELPEISTFEGTTTFTVDTEVIPSNTEVIYYSN